MALFDFGRKQAQGSDAFIQMRDIVKIFKTSAGEFTALKKVNANFHRGEFVSVVGKSGSGKSTLVNMLAGIDHPTSGQVQIGNTYVHKLNESRMARWRGQNLGIVFQFYQLLPMLSLLENVMLPMDFADRYSLAEREKRALDLLDQVGLADLAYKMPAAVSGGQQQCAAIARALANDPPLLIADEPTGNLDSRSADTVFQIFDRMARQGKTIIMVTHDNELANRADRTLILSDGEVIDEIIAYTLPMLSHPQMLRATKKIERQRYEPGQTIITQGQESDRFYIIAEGQTEVHVEQPIESQVVAALGPGEHFGEVELMNQSLAIASIKAAIGSAVEVLTLERQVFVELMDEAYAMREVLTPIVQNRLAENQAFTQRNRYAQAALA